MEKLKSVNEDKPISNFYTKPLFEDKEHQAKLHAIKIKSTARFFEIFDWMIISFFIYAAVNYFLGNWSFTFHPAYFFIVGLVICQTLIYHRFFYDNILKKNADIALDIDITFILLMLISVAELFGGITSPFIFIFFLCLGITVFFFYPYAVPVFLVFELAVIYITASIDLNQANFISNYPVWFRWEIILLATFGALFFAISAIYYRQGEERDKLEEVVSKLVAEKVKGEVVLQSMSDGVFVVDREKRLIFLNEAAEKILKVSKEQGEHFLGHFYGNIFKLRINNKEIDYTKDCPLQIAIAEGKSIFRDDLSLINLSNKTLYITLSSAPVVDASGNAQGAVAIIRDVTKEKEIERIQMEFVSIASHELLTPITQVQGHLSMIVDENIGEVDDTASNIVSNAYKGIKRIARLVRDLMNVSRIQRGSMKMNIVPVDMNSLLENAAKDFQDEAKSNDLQLIFEKPQKPVSEAFGDPDRLGEVINNFIGNAIKFTKKGKIVLSVSEKRDGSIEVSVQDTGIGIEKENFDKVFDKFYQVDSSATREAQGTGLGLYISKVIVEMMNGKIWVESKLGKGSRFCFTLPKVINKIS